MEVTGPAARHLPWPNCYNVRELGGYPIVGGGLVRWRALLRGDNLSRLTPEGCSTLVDYGVRTIIDVRSPSELELDVHPFRVREHRPDWPAYSNQPLLDEADVLGAEALSTLESLQRVNESILERYGSQIAAVIRRIAAAPPGGVLVHCHAGKDRTGLVIALVLALIGVPERVIADDYAASSIYLQPLYGPILAASEDPVRRERLARNMSCPPETALGGLRFLETRYGGVRRYLEAAGLSRPDIARLQARMIEPEEGLL